LGTDIITELTDRPTQPDQELAATLFELGREVASVLDLDELLSGDRRIAEGAVLQRNHRDLGNG
jgi:hypothetical protein